MSWLGVDGVGFQIAPFAMRQIVEHLIAQKLDALAERIFQILRHAGGVSSALIVEIVGERDAAFGAKRIFVQKDRYGLERRFFEAIEDDFEIDAQITLSVPFVPIDDGDLIDAEEEEKRGDS